MDDKAMVGMCCEETMSMRKDAEGWDGDRVGGWVGLDDRGQEGDKDGTNR